ncbi:MAG: ribosomal protein S18-alanine N-acetyltransferase [Halodesulfurarchaeum sp.]
MTTVEPPQGERIRQVVRADLLDVLRIERAVFEYPWDLGSFERFLDAPGFLVMEDVVPEREVGGDVAGYVVATVIESTRRPIGHVKDLAVKPDRQGEGRGRLLLEHSIAALAAQGATEVRLEVRPSNERAIQLYRRHGFGRDRVKPEYYPDGEDALVFTRSFGDRDRF